jgi:hypothetical protein
LSAVITFLVVTTILNIGVGYALALYWAGYCPALQVAVEITGAPQTADGSGTPALAPNRASALVTNASPPVSAQSPAPRTEESDVPVRNEDNEVQERTAAMEQDLLAGIEEFRNQLAQLKAKASVEPMQTR